MLPCRIPKLNYRVFEATVILKNYKDKFISKFNGQELFQRLYAEAEEREMIRCEQGLCFKKGISVRGSHCKYLFVLCLCERVVKINLLCNALRCLFLDTKRDRVQQNATCFVVPHPRSRFGRIHVSRRLQCGDSYIGQYCLGSFGDGL